MNQFTVDLTGALCDRCGTGFIFVVEQSVLTLGGRAERNCEMKKFATKQTSIMVLLNFMAVLSKETYAANFVKIGPPSS